MRHLKLILLAVIVAFVGFVLGRMLLPRRAADAPVAKKEIPTLPPPPKAQAYVPVVPAEAGKKLVLEVPVDGAQIVGDQLDVDGRAKRSVEPVAITLKDDAGKTLATSLAAVIADAGEDFGRFGAVLALQSHYLGHATVEVVWTGADAATERVMRRITFVEKKTTAVNVYFTRSDAPAGKECETVAPRARAVSVATAVYKATLESLLLGPTAEEKKAGFATQIPAKVKVVSVVVDDAGTATADFSSTLDADVAGSCRVTAIRRQIESTLLQFPEIHRVVIQVNGNADAALQP